MQNKKLPIDDSYPNGRFEIPLRKQKKKNDYYHFIRQYRIENP